ncbi:leucine-rich repeat-containing protein 56-like [Mytilus edulis]|uniref:leucine-rich repeat-containing protein 56-like n=1 Tax=Mytilus edulis TaxID=6550 RepID=UPI0039F11AD2
MAVAQDSLYYRLQSMNSSLQGRPESALGARGVQITEFKESRINPEPIVLEDSEVLMEQYLSPGKLKSLTGIQNLEDVRSLELKVDTSDTSLGNFGSLLPCLTQLKLSNSCIPYIRDLGSSLRTIQILWMSRCGLLELDGISSMISLTEVYLSYNEISDISPISMLDNLQILDLEGNNVEDISQVQFLGMCTQLNRLTLESNPVCVTPSPDSEQEDYDYRQAVKKVVPQLCYLDDEVLTLEASPTKKTNVFDADWAYLEELQNDLNLKDDSDDNESSGPPSRPGSASLRPTTGYRPGTVLRPGTGFRPATGSRRPATTIGARAATARPNSSGNRPNTDGTAVLTDDSVSDLTLGKVVCGNPSKALIARRKYNQPKEATQVKLFPQYQHTTEHTFDLPPEDERDREEITSELIEWKKLHEKRMEKIKESRVPQVLVINHDEHDDAISLSGDEDEITTDEELDDFMEGITKIEQANQTVSNPRRVGSGGERKQISPTQLAESLEIDRQFSDPTINQHPLEPPQPIPPIKSSQISPMRGSSPPVLGRIPSRSSVPSGEGRPVHPARSNLSSLVGSSLSPAFENRRPIGAIDTSKPMTHSPPVIPLHRPGTANAVLQPSSTQHRIRRQLPQVPGLPSKPPLPR